MTENKRFELTMRGNEVAQYEIIDHNQENLTVYNDLGCVYFSSAMKVCELLNNLENENKKLNESCVRYGFEVGRLEEENEQLKQFKEKVFTLIDKEIARNEEAIELGKETGADSGAMGFYNHMLKRLKKELLE